MFLLDEVLDRNRDIHLTQNAEQTLSNMGAKRFITVELKMLPIKGKLSCVAPKLLP